MIIIMTDSHSQQPSVLSIPKSDSIVQVSIIDTTTKLVVPAKAFVEPAIKGHETLNFPDYAFLVQNKKLEINILFDVGCRKDYWNLSPAAYSSIKAGIPAMSVEKEVSEILVAGGFRGEISALVWSHWHWDHIGNPSLYPPSTEIIVGPGFKQAFMPGYPGKADSPVLEADFK